MSTYDDPGAFEALYRATGLRVYAYARRHSHADVAPDIVSETYLVAWRRRAELPEDALPWLLITARNVLSAHWRSRSKQERLASELAALDHLVSLSESAESDRLAAVNAFRHLSEADRETLLLVGWDGLTAAQAAQVVGCSPNTFAARLSRARRRLNELTSDQNTSTRPALQAIGDPS